MLTEWTSEGSGIIQVHPRWHGAGVVAGFTFRHGGVSQSPWNSLNLGLHVDDIAEDVLNNRDLVGEQGYGPASEWVFPQQVHGTDVAVVTRADAGAGATPDDAAIPGVDAVVTSDPNVTLGVLAADCVPLLFFDPVGRVIAAAHSGWRGTVGHIAAHVVETMKATFGTDAADLRVAMGPSIRACCYEVDAKVAVPVSEEFGARLLHRRFGQRTKWLLGLQDCIRMDLVDCGVKEEHVSDTGLCTSCRNDVLFSHRADHGRTGRNGALIRLTTT